MNQQVLLLYKVSTKLPVSSSPLHPLKNQAAFFSVPCKPHCFSSSTSTSTLTSTTNYNGWDTTNTYTKSSSTDLHTLLSSLGLSHQRPKDVFLFLLGFASALTLSRLLRLPNIPILILPAGFLLFAAGFTLGFLRNFGFANAGQKPPKDQNLIAFRNCVDELFRFFDEFDVKVASFKGAMEGGNVDLRGSVDRVDDLRVLGSKGRRALEGVNQGLGDLAGGNSVGTRRRGEKEGGGTGFGFLQFFGGLVGGVSKGGKVKDGLKNAGSDEGVKSVPSEKELDSHDVKSSDSRGLSGVENVLSDSGKGNGASVRSEKKGFDLVDVERDGFKLSDSGDFSGHPGVDGREHGGGEDEQRRVGKKIRNDSRFVGREEYSYRSDRLRFINERRVSSNIVENSERGMFGSVNFGVGFERMESEASFTEEERVKESGRVSDSKYSWKRYDDEINRPDSGKKNMGFKDDFRASDDQSEFKSDFNSYMSAASGDDVAFDRYLAEANDLLKSAKEYVAVGQSEEHAEVMLYESANLLSKATDMKPMSLLAVGQLGNTYLIHGELKLKTSRELRAVLSGSKPLSIEKLGRVLKGLDKQIVTRNKLTSALIDVCEECEGLLLEAGRKYRLALSIDGSDVRALYNWGLALSYRAQLIADVGPEAAPDADKIFLAAIDKFDAMLSRGNDHAPEALFKWGVALQQRSRLRPRNSKEKVKLLQQAKRLFEDALLMGSDSVQVRDALLSCVSELNYRNY